MTLLQIKYLIAIAEAGSMNRAAEQLFISQPALTSAVQELEKEIGITLFLRTGRGSRLTTEGEIFLKKARQLYEQAQMLEDSYKPDKKIFHRLRISSQHYAFVAEAFARAVRAYEPERYEFALRETRTVEVIRDVTDARSDIGILFRSEQNAGYLEKLFQENDLVFENLTSCGIYVYLHKDHPLAKEKSIREEMLPAYPFLCFEQGSGSSGFLDEEIIMPVHCPRIIRVTDRATMLDLMASLKGYTFCSGMIGPNLNGGQFTAVPYEGDGAPRRMEIGTICRRHYLLNNFAWEFLLQMRRYLFDLAESQA